MNCKRLLPFLFLSSLLQLLKVVINFDTPSFYFFFFLSLLYNNSQKVLFVVSSLWTDSVLLCPSINFPIAVAVLPLESILSLTLFGVLNQNAGGSPDSNKQRKAPEQLGKVSIPLFDFRR